MAPVTRSTGQPESLDEPLVPEPDLPIEDQLDEEEEPTLRELLLTIQTIGRRLFRVESRLPRAVTSAMLTAGDDRVPPAPAPRPVQTRDPKVNLPPEFSGKVADFRNFMS
jgi:hypothetical protein